MDKVCKINKFMGMISSIIQSMSIAYHKYKISLVILSMFYIYITDNLNMSVSTFSQWHLLLFISNSLELKGYCLSVISYAIMSGISFNFFVNSLELSDVLSQVYH